MPEMRISSLVEMETLTAGRSTGHGLRVYGEQQCSYSCELCGVTKYSFSFRQHSITVTAVSNDASCDDLRESKIIREN